MAINEQYIDNIAQEQLLSDEEERQLADRIKVGDARALEQLTKANLRFVVSLAHHYRGHGLDEDDLVSEGNIALMHAAAQFDGSRGVRFVVFAAPFIRQAMERAIEEQNVLEDTSRKATRRGFPSTSRSRSAAIAPSRSIPSSRMPTPSPSTEASTVAWCASSCLRGSPVSMTASAGSSCSSTASTARLAPWPWPESAWD